MPIYDFQVFTNIYFQQILLQRFCASGHPPYRNTGHSQKALEGFKTMRDGGLLTDVILVAGDTELPAHRTLLVTCNLIFRAFERKKIRIPKHTVLQYIIIKKCLMRNPYWDISYLVAPLDEEMP